MVETSDSVSKALTLWAVVASAVLGGAILVLMSQAPIWGWLVIVVFVLLTFTALLSFSDSASRAFLAGTLRKATYTQIYTTLTRRAVMRVWDALCDPAENRASPATLLRAALTWRLYDRALLIAVAYPILLLVGQWVVTGQPALLGEAEMLAAASFWWDRAAVVGFLVLMLSAKLLDSSLSASPDSFFRHLSGRLVLLTAAATIAFAAIFSNKCEITFIIGGAFAFAVIVTGTSTITGAGAIVGSGAFASAAAFKGAGLGEFSLAVATIFLMARLDKRRRAALARWLVTGTLTLMLLATATFSDLATLPGDRRAIFLFLAVFPLLNAIIDTASYAATLTLMRRGLRSRLPLLCGLVDLVIACGLFLALGAALVGTIHGLNALSGTTLLDLPALLDGARNDPGAHLWLYMMLFSTIVPTALHAGLSLLGVQGLWPRAWRRPVALWVEQANASPLATLRAALALGVIWTLPLVVMGGIVWALWQIAGGVITTGLGHYFNALMWLAT